MELERLRAELTALQTSLLKTKPLNRAAITTTHVHRNSRTGTQPALLPGPDAAPCFMPTVNIPLPASIARRRVLKAATAPLPSEPDSQHNRPFARGANFACPLATCSRRFKRESTATVHFRTQHSLQAKSAATPGLAWEAVAHWPVDAATARQPRPATPPPRLAADLAALFGLFPLTDSFVLATCRHCGCRILPQALPNHLRQDHGLPSSTATAPFSPSASKPKLTAAPYRSGQATSQKTAKGKRPRGGASKRHAAAKKPVIMPLTWRHLCDHIGASLMDSEDTADDSTSNPSSETTVLVPRKRGRPACVSQSISTDLTLGAVVSVLRSSRRFASLAGETGTVLKVPTSSRDTWYTIKIRGHPQINVRQSEIELIRDGDGADPRAADVPSTHNAC